MKMREIMTLVESAGPISADMLPAPVKQDILDMLIGPNCPPAFREYWAADQSEQSYTDAYVSQFIFGHEDLNQSGGYNGNTVKVRLITLDPTVLDNSDRSVSDAVVGQYSKLTSAAPPILVLQNQGTWKLVEGGHRLAAAKARGDKTIQAVDVTAFFKMTVDQWQEM